jgi:zinc transport system substrate-binding protein
MKIKFVLFIFIICFILFFITCGKDQEPAGRVKKLLVYVSIPPQKYFVEKIGQDRLKVEVMVQPGKNPATYEPSPWQITGLGEAAVFFTIGVPFEQGFLPKIAGALKNLIIVDTSSGIEKRILETDHIEEKIPDPHIWLSPPLVKIQAKTILDALIKIDPKGSEIYNKGFEALTEELDRVHEELKEELAPFKGKTIFVYHPVLGYFTDTYGLKQVAIETGGREPNPYDLEEIIKNAREEGVKVIFVQPEFSQVSAGAVAEAIQGVVVPLVPLNPDYINNLKTIAGEIKNGFE